MGLFTWNIRTGYIDALTSYTGLEFARWVLAPGKWVYGETRDLVNRYLYFVGAREENDLLRRQLDAARLELAETREKAAEAERLAAILRMQPPWGWTRSAARIISHRLGPNAALETILIDKGALSDLNVNTPVVTPEGVVGRVLRLSPSAANVLLITDPNSRVPVVSQSRRTQGILRGEGPDRELVVEYVPLESPITEGEILVTSGLEGVFPKGLPAARVTSVSRHGSSLFQAVRARALFNPHRQEEVALLRRDEMRPPLVGPPAPGGEDVVVLKAPPPVESGGEGAAEASSRESGERPASTRP